jgi:hypothetical protein
MPPLIVGRSSEDNGLPDAKTDKFLAEFTS